MIGRKDRMGSFELRTQDTVEGPNSEAYIQHWFQEEFLLLFEEDPEFREQVLKCLLTGDDEDGNFEMRKPRRTWFNGIGETQEVSCEEARYLHLCGETTCTESDMSSEVADEKCHVVLKTNFPTYERPSQQHLDEKRAPRSLEPVTEDLFPFRTFNYKGVNRNQSGILVLGNSKVNYCFPGARAGTRNPFPAALLSETPHKILEESSSGPCVHERGTQTWKANPLYLHSNSDTDSNDSWQQGGSNVAWMDDLENGKMLQEVQMRKVKRLEESQPSQKAEGCHNWRSHSKGIHEIYLSNNIQGLPLYFSEDSKAGHSQRKKSFDKEGAPRSSICVMSEQTDETTATTSTQKNLRENIAPHDGKSINLPFVIERKDQASSCVGVYRDEVGNFTSGSCLTEQTRLYQDLVLKSPLIIVSKDLPFMFIQEEDKALLKHTLSEFSTAKHELNGEVRFPSAQTSGTDESVIYENEKTKTSLESMYPAEERLTCKEELISPVSNFPSSTLLDKRKGNDEETQSLVRSCPPPLLNLDVQSVSFAEEISFPSHCVLATQTERISPSTSSLESAKHLNENTISQGQPHSLLNWECQQIVVGDPEVTLHERNRSAHEQTGSSNYTFDDEVERPALVALDQLATSVSFIGRETTDSLNVGGATMTEKKVTNFLPPRIVRASRFAAIDEEKQVVDAPPTRHDLSASRPIARRATFKPAQDIQWLPPKRNIQFMGMQRTRTHRRLENVKRDSIKWDVIFNRPQPKAPRLAHDEEVCRPWQDPIRSHSSGRHRNGIQRWASLLSKLYEGNYHDCIQQQRM